MSGQGYKLIGWVVVHGGRWYLRRRYGHLVPSRHLVAAGVVGASVAVLAVAQQRRADA